MQFIDQYGKDHFNGYKFKEWLFKNTDICIYIATIYLAFVFMGPHLINRIIVLTPCRVNIIKKFWMVWNLLVSVFSLYGTLRVMPALISDFRQYGLYGTLCKSHPEHFYTTKVGFAMALFVISKVPEFMDTFFLIMTGKRNLPFLSWFHHVTTYLFVWFAYQEGSSIFIVAVALNYTMHTIMYFYFTLTEAGFKNLVRPFAVYITLLQILQMVLGLCTSLYALYQKYLGNFKPEACPGVSLAQNRVQLVIYICNFCLFTELFVKTYVLVPKRSPNAMGGRDEKKELKVK
ncbi:unnamed protein product [Phytomonas sp. Hart1]|nr:unnamed protein product [Phytomonas sp. Hart1]|eukprot:CCW67908.1 unnamed protein product [Phytomonas sp. isolate Hart1]